MEAEVPCVEVVYQRLVQLVAGAFYASDLKVLFAEEETEKAPLPSGRSKKQPVLLPLLSISSISTTLAVYGTALSASSRYRRKEAILAFQTVVFSKLYSTESSVNTLRRDFSLRRCCKGEIKSRKRAADAYRRSWSQADYTGLGTVVMGALLYRPWWEEEEFARLLGLPMRPVRQILRLLEKHCLVAREHRKEKKKKEEGKESDPQLEGDVVDESMQDRGNLISYCSLDYQRFFDMTRLRIFKIHRRLKEELEDRRAVQEYICSPCERSYTSLQAPFLIKSDGLFHCEECESVLETAANGQADGLSRRERTKLVKAKQAKVAEELKPLTVLLVEIEKKLASGQQIPDFGTLASWAQSEARRTGAGSKNDSAGRQPGVPQINISMADASTQARSGSDVPRELPPWLRRQGGPQGTPPSTSYSLSQEVSGDYKDAKDIKSASPEDEKKLEEDEVMRQYKERMAQIAARDSQPTAKRQRVGEGWQEAVPGGEDTGGWQEVAELPVAAPKPEAAIKQEPGPGLEEMLTTPPVGAQAADEDDWEDA